MGSQLLAHVEEGLHIPVCAAEQERSLEARDHQHRETLRLARGGASRLPVVLHPLAPAPGMGPDSLALPLDSAWSYRTSS